MDKSFQSEEDLSRDLFDKSRRPSGSQIPLRRDLSTDISGTPVPSTIEREQHASSDKCSFLY